MAQIHEGVPVADMPPMVASDQVSPTPPDEDDDEWDGRRSVATQAAPRSE